MEHVFEQAPGEKSDADGRAREKDGTGETADADNQKDGRANDITPAPASS